MATVAFKVKWADLATDVNAADRQVKVMAKLSKLLKQDNLTLSHTDDDGFAVYLPEPAKRKVRKRGLKP